jgi:hypothetical protein
LTVILEAYSARFVSERNFGQNVVSISGDVVPVFSREDATMRKIVSIAAFVTVSMLAAAQPRPNFEGTWRMDKARSQYPAESGTELIHQHGDVLDISFTEKWPGHPDTPMHIHLSADGKPTVNTTGGNKFTATTHWDHSKLITFVQGDRGQHMTEMHELSPDGKELTVTGYHQDELTRPYYVRLMVKARPNPEK